MSAYVVGASFAVLLACSGKGDVHDHDDFREDVIDCEDAVAYLTSCCPGFSASKLRCQYHYDSTPAGCESSGTVDSESPALGLNESRCILASSCDTIVRNGICARAQAATAYTTHTSSGGYSSSTGASTDTSSHAPVCP